MPRRDGGKVTASARWRRTGLQTRVTLLAGAAVAVALLAGALLLVTVLRSGLTAAVDDRAGQRLVEVERLVAEQRLPAVIPAADPTVLVQVLSPDGGVVAATTGTSRAVPLLTPDEITTAVRAQRSLIVEGSRAGYGEALRVRVLATESGPVIVTAVPVTAIDDPLRLVRTALLTGLPLLLLASAGGVWITVGRTLRPVEQLRAGADAVTAAQPSLRLPVPAAEDEVRRLAETLNGMLDRLESGGARQRAFVADAAHELRSPLAAVQTTLEVALVHPEPDGAESAMRTALEEVLRMGRLVGDLLLLARLDAGATGSARPARPVDVAAVVREVSQALPPGGRTVVLDLGPGLEPDLTLDVRPDSDEGPGLAPTGVFSSAFVVADRDALGRVVRNLVENALRHAEAVVRVTVIAGNPVELLVDDDGQGIPADDRGRVFDRFTRLDTPRSRDAGGSGLGLAIVKELVTSLGGTVTVEASPAGGARLRVLLPGPERHGVADSRRGTATA